jgi:hypothetical protein
MQRIGIIVLLFFMVAVAAYGQEPGQFYLLAGGQFSYHTRATADLGIVFAMKEAIDSIDTRCGFIGKPLYDFVNSQSGRSGRCGIIIEAGLGHGGARYSAGVWAIDDSSFATGDTGSGFDVRFVMNRTFSSPRGATPNSKYIGFEAGMRIAYIFRISAGVSRRISGPSGPHGTLITWSAGAQIPIPLFKIR